MEIEKSHNNIQIQFILRDYTSHSQVLHGFDISSCSVSFDGTTTRFTSLGAWSYLNKLNIVWPAYRSTSYEHRLVKYWNKDFGLVFPHLENFILGMMNLPYLLLNIIYFSGNFAYGNIFLDSDVISDYSPKFPYSFVPSCLEIQNRNVFNILQNKDIYTFYKRYSIHNKSNKLNIQIISNCHNICGIVSESVFNTILDRLPYYSIYIMARKMNINFYLLKKIFKFDEQQISKLLEIVSFYNILMVENPNIKYNIDEESLHAIFNPLIDKFKEQYNILKTKKINWWIPFNYNIPFTGSLNPIIEDPTNWYGEFSIRDVELPDDRIFNKSISTSDKYNEEQDMTCSLCYCLIIANNKNIVKLNCGHLFHGRKSLDCDCMGVNSWISRKKQCPICRCKIIKQKAFIPIIINFI